MTRGYRLRSERRQRWASGGTRGNEKKYDLVLLAFALGRLGADLLVVLLEGGEVLAGLGELALLHARPGRDWIVANFVINILIS